MCVCVYVNHNLDLAVEHCLSHVNANVVYNGQQQQQQKTGTTNADEQQQLKNRFVCLFGRWSFGLG